MVFCLSESLFLSIFLSIPASFACSEAAVVEIAFESSFDALEGGDLIGSKDSEPKFAMKDGELVVSRAVGRAVKWQNQ